MMYNSISIKGAKKKPKQPRKPVIAKDSASSISFFKGLYGTSEGPIYGLVDGGKSIFLEGTPLLDEDGNPNFENVTWEERKGTLDQEYMKGFPDVSNEVGIGVELKGGTPWVRSITNTQLSALRLRFKWDRLAKTNPDNGDVTGYRIDYAIDLRTDGGAYQEVLSTKIEDKTSAGYERTHRIDLPKSKTGWSVRVRRITPNANSEYIADRMYVDALAEVIDVKLAYPYTAGIGLQYNAETFNGVAKVEFLKRGRILKVPTNYNAETRAYTGIWNGTFKESYSNNPAWVYYDLLTNKRYGLGHRLDASMIDKWGIYNLARYCDDMVSDGQGGLEPRFTCNVYLQKQATAYEVLQHIAGIFSALSYWNGEKIFLDADVPRDPVFTFTNANVVGGNFSYSGTRDRDRHNIIKVAWDNPANGFKTEYEYVRDEKSIALNGIKPLDLAAFGCTSQSQAQRLGLRALKTEQLETQQVTFSAGLAAINCKVGDVIAISDASLAGKSNGGLISNVAGNVITIDRDAVINIGDTLTVNTAKGLSERRNVTAVSGRNITVAAAFDGAEREHVWSVESSDLKMQLFRVMSVTENDDATYSVLGIQHEPQKFNAIDFGTDVKPTSISIVDDIAITPPESVVIKSRHRVEQGQTVATLIIEWSQVKEAVAYEVEWRKDDGAWIRVPRTGTNSVEIDGVYAGQYLARVRSVGAFDTVSNATTSMLTEVKGKVGKPPKLAALNAVGILFGMELSWSFAPGSKDADYVEIEQGSAPDTNVSLLGQFSYPTDRHEITGLQGGLTRSYRARLVDKLGFKSDWSEWSTATVDDSADKVLDLIEGQITESHLYEALTKKIGQIEPINQRIGEEIDNRIKAIDDIAQQIALVSSGIGEQFDSLKIWHFDKDVEGWTGGTYSKGFINARTTALTSPTVAIDGAKYKHVKLRIEKVGSPTWSGLVTWSGGSSTIPEPQYTDNVATVGVSADWPDSLNGFSIKLAQTADNLNYYKVDWIAVGHPSPGASFAALLDEKSERQLGDKANATKIEGVIAFTGADSDMAGSTQDLAGADSRLAGSWSVYDAIIDGDNYTGQRLDTTIAKVEENKAAVLKEQLARVDGDKAIAADVTLLKSDYGKTKTAVERLELAYSTPESGVAASITRLEVSVTEAKRLLTEKGEIIFSYGEPPADKRGAANLWFKLKDEADKSISQTPHSWDGSKWVELKAAAALDAKRAAEAAQGAASAAQGTADAAQGAAAAAQGAANAAAGAAKAAKDAADEADRKAKVAQGQVDDISADGKLTPVEKKQANLIWSEIVKTDTEVKANAAKYKVSVTTYDAAYTALDAYLKGLITGTEANTTSNIDRAAFDKAFADVYAARAEVNKLIVAAAEKQAADAQSTANNKGENIYSSTAPDVGKQLPQNIWYKIEGNVVTAHAWANGKWTPIVDKGAADAKSAADSKGEVIYSSTTPDADKRLTQNIWIDTAAGKNTPKRWDGSAWVIVSDKSVLEQIGKENVASFVRTSGSFVTEFNGISGEIATNQAVINGVRQSIEVVNSIGDADKLKTEITKAEIAKNVAGVEAQRDKLNVLIADYTKKRTEATSSRDKATDASVKAVYQTQIDVLTKSITETTAERNSLNARITELNKNISELNSLKLTESNVKKQYFVKFDSGNRAAGFGIMENADATIDFAILADKFYIASPSGTGKGVRPFAVYTSPTTINGVTVPAGTYLDGNLLATGTITGDKIAAKTEINAPIIKGGQININDKFIVDSLGNVTAKNGTFEGDVRLKNGQVDTLQIAGNAVTVPVSEYTSGIVEKESQSSKTLSIDIGSITLNLQSNASVSITAFVERLEAYAIVNATGPITRSADFIFEVIRIVDGNEVVIKSVKDTVTASGSEAYMNSEWQGRLKQLPPTLDTIGAVSSVTYKLRLTANVTSGAEPRIRLAARGVTFTAMGVKR